LEFEPFGREHPSNPLVLGFDLPTELYKEGVPLLPGRTAKFARKLMVFAMVLMAVASLLVASCSFTNQPFFRPADLAIGWPAALARWAPKTSLPPNWQQGKQLWQPQERAPVKVELPQLAAAEVTGLDAQCVLCHETYTMAFSHNVHRQQGCEGCHGPASRHLASRGEGPESILSFKSAETISASGKLLAPAQRSEICLSCHEPNPDSVGHNWRRSAHAHETIACDDCHVAHYNVPRGTPATIIGSNRPPPPEQVVRIAQQLRDESSLAGTSHALAAETPHTCYQCHEVMRRFEDPIHPHQIGKMIVATSGNAPEPWATSENTFQCTTCHNAHGSIRHETRKELCLQCHDGPHFNEWHGSQHDLAGIGCTDCHNPHPETGVSMTVDEPNVCYRCHSETRELEEIAGPHQLLGINDFKCSTCHQPHAGVTAETRTDRCLSCHTGSPTMAWHSSFHAQVDVACADCHMAHPSNTRVPRIRSISHTSVAQPQRLPMSVQQPDTCYGCHPQVFAASNMPSHHPIGEGKLVCSDCHESHGQGHGSLRAESLNQLCFQCHTEKEGPFVWEHAPVTESCAICHAPHGTVANNLLHQPTTFLCLRCHTGHSTHAGSPQCNRCHLVDGEFTNVGGGPRDPTIATDPALRQALFTDCTQCHSQIHGSDNPSGYECGHGMRR
jgi:DmsE family decaheme c-type cytochrome